MTQLRFVKDDEVIQGFPAHRRDESFGIGIHVWCAHGGGNTLDVVKRIVLDKLRGTVVDEIRFSIFVFREMNDTLFSGIFEDVGDGFLVKGDAQF